MKLHARPRRSALLIAVIVSSFGPSAVAPSPIAAVEPGQPPDGRVEIPGLRHADSRTFQLPNGKMLTELFAQPVYYQPDNSTAWQPIDPRFATGTGTAAESTHAPAQVVLDAADSSAGFLRLSGNGLGITLRLPPGTVPGRTGSAPVVANGGAYADYTDFLPGGIGLRVFPHADGYKMFLVQTRDRK